MSQTGPSDRTQAPNRPPGVRRNSITAAALAGFVALMIGFSFAAVPLYRMFCAATGFDGTPQRAASPSRNQTDLEVTVHFDANTAPGLPWSFEPVQAATTLRAGENKITFFRAVNQSAVPVTGSAVFNVSPEIMGQYFTKVQCFCFTEQTLQPGESIELPVSFYIDPAMAKDRDAKTIRDIVLSYTFYRVQNGTPASAGLNSGSSALTLKNPG
jgi:cytochrome c oxidase assembly protein subunit 11